MPTLASDFTVKDIINSPSLNQLVQKIGKENVVKIIAEQIFSIKDFVKVDFNIESIIKWSHSILSDNPSLSIEDIILSIKRGIKGCYGDKIYGALSYRNLCFWISKYQDEKIDEIEKQIHNKKFQSHKENEDKMLLLKSFIKNNYKTIDTGMSENTLGKRLKKIHEGENNT